jgi:hypothetical protein
MFILRKLTGFTEQENQELGDNYRVITYKDYKEFQVTKTLLEETHDIENVTQFVIADGETYPVYDGESAFIMTDRGKTFANITIPKIEVNALD